MSQFIRCPKCELKSKDIQASKAAEYYHKLKNYLSIVPSWGCYTPHRPKLQSSSEDHRAWPLHYWKGPSYFPLIAEFKKDGDKLTFAQFCKVYGLNPIEDEDGIS